MIEDRGEVEAGQIAMAYQNFIICIEMVLASIGLLYGFPHSDYKVGGPQAGSPEVLKGVAANLKNVRVPPCVCVEHGRQLCGSRLCCGSQTLNPKDVIDDTIRNFSSTYKKYARAHVVSMCAETRLRHFTLILSTVQRRTMRTWWKLRILIPTRTTTGIQRRERSMLQPQPLVLTVNTDVYPSCFIRTKKGKKRYSRMSLPAMENEDPPDSYV